jgi:hypothetical protein
MLRNKRKRREFEIEMVRDLHFDFDSKNTLAKQDVTDGVVNEVAGGLTGVDHESIGELHRLGPGSTNLSRNNNLATLGARLHDETEDTVASTKYRVQYPFSKDL